MTHWFSGKIKSSLYISLTSVQTADTRCRRRSQLWIMATHPHRTALRRNPFIIAGYRVENEDTDRPRRAVLLTKVTGEWTLNAEGVISVMEKRLPWRRSGGGCLTS